MTVSYQYEVASSTSGGFTRLLFMWKGSLYKLIYRELFLFLVAFGVLSALYRNTFNSDQRRIFEKMVMYCDTFINLIPLSFVLGFYVAYVAGRWWQQYMAIPWPDKIMHSIALYVSGTDEHARMVRRTLMRYLNLTLILVLRSISSAVKRRFPTLEHVVDSGFMTTVELEMFQSVPSLEFNTYWIPCTWFISLLKESKKNQQIEDSQGLHIIMEEFNDFRSKCGLLWSYDWVSIPLVYTQVVTIATYSFFLAALVGRQYVDAAKKPLQMEIDIYLPVFTILQFFFFMGLLKVAEQLINPFGDDDEDFELNWLIDRHTKVSYLGVDILMSSAPPLVKDMYFDQVDLTLPYTEAAVAYKKRTYRGSVHNMTTQFPSTQSFHKVVEVDPEFETCAASSCNVEMPSHMATIPPEQKSRGVDTLMSGNNVASKPSKLSRSESVPLRQSVFSTKSMLGWPSSSTLAHSDASFRCSEQSFEMQSCYDSVSNLGNGMDRSPQYEKEQFFSPSLAMRGTDRGDYMNGAYGGGKECISSSTGDGSKDSTGKNEFLYNVSGATGGVGGFSDSWNNRLNVGQEVNCNHSPQLSQLSIETPPIPKQYEHYLCKPKEEVEYVTFRKSFRSACLAKVKSCPKLVLVKRQHSANNGKKKGVRWKPMISPIPGKDGSYCRRQTVDVVPQTPDPTLGIIFPPCKTNGEEGELVSNVRCLWCKKQTEGREALLRRVLSGDSEQYVNNSADSVSSSSVSQELCPLHQRIASNEARKASTASPLRLADSEVLPPKCLPFQERRATVSTLSLTGSELEAKRWQSRSFWERGFFKKMKLLYSRKGTRAVPAVLKSHSLYVRNKHPLSQSLPNLMFAHFDCGSRSATEPQTPIFANRVMPTVRISDMTESEDSSYFASIMEMQEDEANNKEAQSSKIAPDAKIIPTISLNLPGNAPELTPNNNSLVSNNSAEYLNARSEDSSWQSADWTGILDLEKKQNSGIVKDEVQKEVPSSSPEGISVCAVGVLQEVVVDNSNGTYSGEQLDKSVS